MTMSSPNLTLSPPPSFASANSTTEYAYLCCPRNFFVGPRYLHYAYVSLREPCPDCVRAIAAQAAIRTAASRTLEGRKKCRRSARLRRWRWRDLWCSKLRFGERAPSFDLLGPAGEGIEKGIVNGAMKEAEQILRRLRRAARVKERRALFEHRQELAKRREKLLENVRRTTEEIATRQINMAAELASLRESRLRRTREVFAPMTVPSDLISNVSDRQIGRFPQLEEPALPQALPAFLFSPAPGPIAEAVAEERHAVVSQSQNSGLSLGVREEFSPQVEIGHWTVTWDAESDTDSDVGLDLTDFDGQDRAEAFLITEFEQRAIAQTFPRPQSPDWRRDWRPRRGSRPEIEEDADEIEGGVRYVQLPWSELINSMNNLLIEEQRRLAEEGQIQAGVLPQ